MKIGDLAKESGMSRDTIRFYERIGLLPAAFRNRSGHRDYDPSILTWVTFLGHLKATGMSLADMTRYAKLREQGHATGADRSLMLQNQRHIVKARIAELQACLAVLDDKIAGYAAPETPKDKR